MPTVNLLTVLVAAIATMALGFLWYSPTLFGEPWMKLMGFTKESMEKAKKNMGPMYGLSFVATLVMALVLAYVVKFVGAMTLAGGLKTGFGMWLGFVGPVQMTDVIFGGKSWKLYKINTGYQLVSLVLMGAILALWG